MEKIKKAKSKVVLYVKNYKHEIVLTTISLIAIIGFCIEKNDSRNLKLENKLLTKMHRSDLNKISKIKKENHYLKELCKEKDEFFSKAISESMRLGGSFGGQQMAYKRWDN